MILNQPNIQVGGTLDPRTSSIYVKRPGDELFLGSITESKAWINIYGCRTMGKSSLYAQYLAHLTSQGVTALVIDIPSQVADAKNAPSNAADWFRMLGDAWTASRGLDYTILDESLRGLRGNAPGTVAERLLSRGLLKQLPGPVVLILDEYDCIADLPYCDDILFVLRHLQSVQARTTDLDRLSLCLVGFEPVHHLGRPGAANASPICKPVEMLDFETSERTRKTLLQAFSKEQRPHEDVIAQVLNLSGGQPLLTMNLLSEARDRRCKSSEDVQIMAEELVSRSGLGADLQVFEGMDKAIRHNAGSPFAALSAYKSLLEGRPEAQTAPGLELLRACGVLRRRGGQLEVKSPLFRRRFDEAWIERTLSLVAGSARLQQFRGSSKTSDKRICVINAGGTLGMVQRGAQVVPPRDEEEFKGYFTFLDTIANTKFIDLFPPRDSINMFPGQWTTIARYIYERRNDGFDGFVVAHGTDTMAYTASAVAFALGTQLRFPVVFTGAQTTPDVAYGDAHVNLYRACEVAKKAIPEVVISFGNFVYRAVRAQKKDDRRFDGFESPTYPPLAEITGEINVRAELLRPLPGVRSDIDLQADFEHSILIVPQFPGLEPGFFSHLLDGNGGEQPCRGVIVQTLGAGNVTSEDPYSFIPFVERAFRSGIPVIVTSQYPPEPGTHTRYTPAQAPIEAGAIHAGNMTLAAAVTKFRWVLAHVRRRRDWQKLAPEKKRRLVSKLMVEQSLIGEF